MDLIINSILVGFGFCSIIYVIGFRRMMIWNENLTLKIDLFSCLIFSLGGIIYAGRFGIDIYQSYSMTLSEYEQYGMLNRMFGQYWFGFWAQPTLYLVSTQLMWIRSIRKKNIFRLIIGFLLMLPFEEIAQIATSHHREYISTSFNFSLTNLLINWVTSLGFFVIIVGATFLIGKKIKNAV